jgi:hypothetical protein
MQEYFDHRILPLCFAAVSTMCVTGYVHSTVHMTLMSMHYLLCRVSLSLLSSAGVQPRQCSASPWLWLCGAGVDFERWTLYGVWV